MFNTLKFITWLPPYAFALGMYMFVLGTMFLKRNKHQGQGFQVSRSAFFGFAAICVSYGVAGELLEVPDFVKNLPEYLQNGWFDLAYVAVSVAVGLVFQGGIGTKEIGHGWDVGEWKYNTERADLIYALVLLPISFYFWIVTVLVVYSVGTPWAWFKLAVCYLIFLMTLRHDIKYKLMDQTKVMQEWKIKTVRDTYRPSKRR